MVRLSSGVHAALESSFKKEPVLWDANQCTSYSGRDLVKKVDRIHSAMCQFVLEAERPWPEDVQAFFATISKNLFDILAKLRLDAWQQWSLALVTAEHIITQYGERSMLPVREPSPEPSVSDEDGSPSPTPPPKCPKTSASSSKGKGKETKPVVKTDVRQFGPPGKRARQTSKLAPLPKLSYTPFVDVPKITSKAVAPKTETKPTARGSRAKTTGSPTPGVSAPPAKKTKPVVVHKGRAWGRNVPEEPIDDMLDRMSPPPATLAEEITNMVDSHEMMPVTMETLLQCTTMDLAIVGVLKVPPSGKTGFCSCVFDADVLWDVKERMFRVNYSCNSLLKFHERCFWDADDNVATCIVQLQRVYETRATTFANIVRALDQIECDHDTDAVLKVTRKYPVSCRLFIEMGYQVGEEYQEIDDTGRQRTSITMIIEPALSPIKEELGLVVPSLLLGSTIEVVPDSDDAVMILNSLAKVDNLLHRASDASSDLRRARQIPRFTGSGILSPKTTTQVVNSLATPLIAHKSLNGLPETVICSCGKPGGNFLVLSTLTRLPGYSNPKYKILLTWFIPSCHFSSQQPQPGFSIRTLVCLEVSVPSLGILSARCPRLRLTPTGAFKQGLNWFHFHMLSLAEDMTQKSLPIVIVYFVGILESAGTGFTDRSRTSLPAEELGGLFGPDDQFPGDEGLPYPRYSSKLFFHVEPVLLGEFMAVGLNVIQLGPETLPSCINAAFELLYLAGTYPVCYLPVLAPEESIFHLNSYV
ncbi:hypothetical protein IW261DRAFT_1427047 [Armillaria novae-zelandiae]|uniref:Uncharacterized protein n=1 Tax=Armillaria novae-zelandiae TaxID=153914 RepID=A0AA39NHT4_9AGAR|nr:hypothetical protein IW261DRAFT_1427047 [Armillaria novae-zelandiae]